MNYDGLEIIAAKPPIVATHVGDFGDKDGHNTIARYEKEVSTYVRPPEIQRYQRKFVEAILAHQTSIGCLVAPFGYGKTSATIDIWHGAEQTGLLAIPPFSCSSVSEMGAAIASGAAMLLEKISPEASQKVHQAYNDYLVSSANRLARQDAEQYDIEFDMALRSIQDKIERGFLQIEASGINLLAFLEKLVTIALEAGLKGVLIIIDEFQQFLGVINKTTITNFRTLVWGLKTRKALPLGLLITMDPDTERNLSERAGDILHRIKEDGYFLDFSSVYDREFPRLLWERYAETFGFQDDSRKIVDRATLEAIGQICERPDLSNGPRTVINAFQEIAAAHPLRQKPYTPLDLIDDFLTGGIKFDGDTSKIASLVTELTAYDYIKRTPERVDTIKLIAAFPRGCPYEVAENYGLTGAFEQLSDELRGEILTRLPEGIALIDLQRVGKPQNKLNIILKKYWMQITEEEIISERILSLFGRYAVEKLFPSSASVLSGWKRVESEYTLSPLGGGGYWQIYTGTYAKEYPLRRICVQICRDIAHAADPSELDKEFDLNLVFVLHQAPSGKDQGRDAVERAASYHPAQQTYIFNIPVNESFSMPLARDIRWIEDYLSPVVMTPGVLLSLVDYIEHQVPNIEGITEAERLRIGDIQRKLQDFLLVMLFDENLFTGLEVSVISRGVQAFRDALFSIFRSAYPDYHTLIILPQWISLLDRYSKALKSISLPQRRGIEELVETKSAIASRFGYRSHAGFQSQIKQYPYLLSEKNWKGDKGRVLFSQHPGEIYLLKTIVGNNELNEDALFLAGRKAGYISKEIAYLLEFLKLRGYIQYIAETKTYRPTQTLSYQELANLGEDIVTETNLLHPIMQDSQLLNIRDEVNNMLRQLQQDDAQVEDIQVQLLQKQRLLRQRREDLKQRLRANLHASLEQLYSLIETLKEDLPLSKTSMEIDTHLNGVQRTMTAEHRAAQKALLKTATKVSEFLKRPIRVENIRLAQLGEIIAAYHRLSEQIQSAIKSGQTYVERANLHHRWIGLTEQLQRASDYLEVTAQITSITHLQRTLDDTVDKIKRDLATIGLKDYQGIYETYAPVITQLSDEVNAAVQAAALAQARSQNGPTAPTSIVEALSNSPSLNAPSENGRSALLDILQSTKQLSVSKLLDHSEIPPEQLFRQLVDLEQAGKITTRIEII